MLSDRIGLLGRFPVRDAAALLLFFLLPFDHKFSNIAIGLILSLSLIDLFKGKQTSGVEVRWIPIPWILPALFVYFFVSQLTFGGDWHVFEKRLLLVFVPLTFALTISFFNVELRTKLFASYILGNVAVLMICFVRAIIRSLSFQDGSISFNAKVIQNSEHDFLTSSIMGGNYFFEEEFSLFFHPMYFGLYIVLAQYLIFEIGKSDRNRIPKVWMASCYVLFIVGLFFLSSKSAIITSLLLTVYLFLRLKVQATVKIAFMAGIITIGLLFIYHNPKLRILTREFSVAQFFQPDPLSQTSHGLRILSWNASLDIIKENIIFGVGEGNKEAALLSEYHLKGYVIPSEELHNSHNQYLDFLIGGGIIGFTIFIAGIATLFVKSLKKNNRPLMVLLTIFCFMSLFENLLSRHAGLLIFTIFVSLLGSEPNMQWKANGRHDKKRVIP